MASYSVNKRAVAKARELIAARQYVLDSEWGEVQGANDETKTRYGFVYGDFPLLQLIDQRSA